MTQLDFPNMNQTPSQNQPASKRVEQAVEASRARLIQLALGLGKIQRAYEDERVRLSAMVGADPETVLDLVAGGKGSIRHRTLYYGPDDWKRVGARARKLLGPTTWRPCPALCALAVFASQAPRLDPAAYATAKKYRAAQAQLVYELGRAREAIHAAAKAGVANETLVALSETTAVRVRAEGAGYRVTFEPRKGVNYRRGVASVARDAANRTGYARRQGKDVDTTPHCTG